MKYFCLGFLGYVAALTSAPSHYNLARGGACGFPASATQVRAAVPAALYENGRACGVCLKSTNHNNQSTVAHITDKCVGCPETEFLIGSSVQLKLSGSPSWSRVACPPPASITWHKDSQKFWALFQIKNYPEEIKVVRAYSNSWVTLVPTPWHEYSAPSIDVFVMEYFRIEIEGVSQARHQYIANFPYANQEPPQSDVTNYPGPVFRLIPA
ncbi:hypothetical protein DSO57_1028710 [Entomophthora muscae]|uniref:Uncharacterized protein n=1 Tax=Entomophthora muscae TaxID=34485 RepID=A0ACC2TCB2_9FUNG|nr:hypothetical protein DSO57_1028710 [Entomophthora muscae]